MSSEQITQETVPVEKTSTEAQPQATQATETNAELHLQLQRQLNQLGKNL